MAFLVGREISSCCCRRGSQVRVLLADALHDVGQVCLPVLWDPRQRLHSRHGLGLVGPLPLLTAPCSLSRVVAEDFTARLDPLRRHVLLPG